MIAEFKQLPFAASRLKELRELARSRGGECLAEKYLGTGSKLPWRCTEGHEWDADVGNVKNGSWCPTCSGRKLENVIHEFNPRRAMRGADAARVEVTEATCEPEWMWMNKRDLSKNIKLFGEHPELLKAKSAYAAFP